MKMKNSNKLRVFFFGFNIVFERERITWVKVENLVTNLSPNLVTNLVITKLGDVLGDKFGDIFGDILGDYQI